MCHVHVVWVYFTLLLIHNFVLLHLIIGDVMVSMFSSSVVGHGFEYWSGQNKDYKIGIWYY
jgi:hypothetical protein